MTRGQTQCFACKAAYKQHCAVKARVDVENDGGETSDAPLGQAMILSMQPAAFTSDHSPPTSYHSDPSLTLATGPAVGATAAGGSIEAALNATRTAARTAAAAIAPFDNGQQAMTLSATSALCRVPQHPHHAPSAETAAVPSAAAASAATTITHAASAATTIVTNTDQCVPEVARVIRTRVKFESKSNVCLLATKKCENLPGWWRSSALRPVDGFLRVWPDDDRVEHDFAIETTEANLRESVPGAVLYTVRNIGGTVDGFFALLANELAPGRFICWDDLQPLQEKWQPDFKRRFIAFDGPRGLKRLFENHANSQQTASLNNILEHFRGIFRQLLHMFHIDSGLYKLGVMFTELGAVDQVWHADGSMRDTYSIMLALMQRSVDFVCTRNGAKQREVFRTTMQVKDQGEDGKDFDGVIFESTNFHRGTGAPLPPEHERGPTRSHTAKPAQSNYFKMRELNMKDAKIIQVQSIALHLYAGKNGTHIPDSDRIHGLIELGDSDAPA